MMRIWEEKRKRRLGLLSVGFVGRVRKQKTEERAKVDVRRVLGLGG